MEFECNGEWYYSSIGKYYDQIKYQICVDEEEGCLQEE